MKNYRVYKMSAITRKCLPESVISPEPPIASINLYDSPLSKHNWELRIVYIASGSSIYTNKLVPIHSFAIDP